MTKEHWEFASAHALQLFKRGQDLAKQNGLILVDTKYEMGLTEEGEILLIDEIHTPIPPDIGFRQVTMKGSKKI